MSSRTRLQRKEAKLLDFSRDCDSNYAAPNAFFSQLSAATTKRPTAHQTAAATQFSERLMKFYFRCEGDGRRTACSFSGKHSSARLAAAPAAAAVRRRSQSAGRPVLCQNDDFIS